MTKPPFSPSATIAIAIPCYQEEKTIGQVVADFKRELPNATIYVFDNNCTDRTAEVAGAAGAVVIREKKQGKGYVVASIFELIDADIMVMVDGDGTYDAAAVHRLIQPILLDDADMVVGARLAKYADNSFRKFHVAGNQFVCWIINRIFDARISDIFSGYRAFTRECMLAIPITSRGFDVETELTVQALYRGLVLSEIEAPYGERPPGSFSKLRTIPDGIRVFMRLFLLLRSYKPLTLFGSIFLLFLAVAILSGTRPLVELFTERHISSLASAIAASSALVLGFSSLSLGLLLNSAAQRLLELERITIKRIKKLSALPLK